MLTAVMQGGAEDLVHIGPDYIRLVFDSVQVFDLENQIVSQSRAGVGVAGIATLANGNSTKI
jgi:hypothetical protein